MNVLSLFDGMSCGQIALNRAGIKYDNYYASEIDKYAIKVTQANYPDTIQLGSVVGLQPLSDIDLLIGGSPCQGFSFAGKQLAFNDPRSKLFFEWVRIWRECKPKWWLLENVKMNKKFQDIISEILCMQPTEINSGLVSAQNRKRLYWTNIHFVMPEDKGIYLKDILQENIAGIYELSDTAIQRLQNRKWSQAQINPEKSGTINPKNNSGQLSTDSGTTLILSEKQIERGMYQAKSKVWHTGNKMGKMDFPNNINKKAKTLCTISTNGGRETNHIIIQRERGFNKGNIFENKSPTLSSNSWQYNNHLSDGYAIRRLTEVECERLQTVPDNYTNHVSSTQRYKMLGNGWTVDVIAHIFKSIK